MSSIDVAGVIWVRYWFKRLHNAYGVIGWKVGFAAMAG